MLLSDEQHDYPGYGGTARRCRVRLYLPAEGSGSDHYIVILTDEKGSHGTSITNLFEAIAARVCGKFRIPPERTVFIEHYDHRRHPGGHDGQGHTEDFARVCFGVPQAQPDRYSYIHGLTLGKPAWKPTDKQSVEMLIDCPLP